MKFFNLDLHISVIADVKSIFEDLGHSVDTWSISGHAHIMGQKLKKVEYINQNTWQNIDEKSIELFYKKYKNELSEYDGFIVTHTPCFSMLYEKFEKPIITIASTRYESPFHSDMLKWSKFNYFLQDSIDNGTIIPVANNKYDKKYTELFTNRTWKHIPSLCNYTKANYRGTINKFLYSSKFNPILDIENLVNKSSALSKNYSWQDLADYKGIVHIPYNVSTMSIFEQYTSNIPLFFPSLSLMKDLREKYSNNGVLSEISWNQVYNLPSNSVLFCGIEDPNNYNSLSEVMKWAELSDFYDKENMPHIQYFDSFEHLKEILNSCNLEEISNNMKEHNISRKKNIYNDWSKILKGIK
jgi:hypothetical protein